MVMQGVHPMFTDDRSIKGGGSFYKLSLLDNRSPNVSKHWIFYMFMIIMDYYELVLIIYIVIYTVISQKMI